MSKAGKILNELIRFIFPIAIILFFTIFIEQKEIYDEGCTPTKIYGFPFAFFGDIGYRHEYIFLISFLLDFIFYIIVTAILWVSLRQLLFKKKIKKLFSFILYAIAGIILSPFIFYGFYFFHFRWDLMNPTVIEDYWAVKVFPFFLF